MAGWLPAAWPALTVPLKRLSARLVQPKAVEKLWTDSEGQKCQGNKFSSRSTWAADRLPSPPVVASRNFLRALTKEKKTNVH